MKFLDSPHCPNHADTDFVINSMTDFIIRDIRNSMIMLHDDKTKFFVLGDR